MYVHSRGNSALMNARSRDFYTNDKTIGRARAKIISYLDITAYSDFYAEGRATSTPLARSRRGPFNTTPDGNKPRKLVSVLR